MSQSRRILIKSLIASSVAGFAIPTKWSKPVVGSVMLPVHAQTTGVEEPPCPDSGLSFSATRLCSVTTPIEYYTINFTPNPATLCADISLTPYGATDPGLQSDDDLRVEISTLGGASQMFIVFRRSKGGSPVPFLQCDDPDPNTSLFSPIILVSGRELHVRYTVTGVFGEPTIKVDLLYVT